MDFFDKINSIAKNATEKTGNMIETSKLNSKIAAEERNISALTIKIGEYFIAKMDCGEALDSEVMSMYESIKNCRSTIEGYRSEISALNAPKEDELAPDEEAPEGDFIICPLCGTKMPSGSKFCTACGAKLPEKQEENC